MDDIKPVVNVGEMTVNEATELYKSLREKLKGVQVGGPGRKPARDYESWDWGKKNSELAREHGANYTYVCIMRRKLGKAPVSGGKHYPACLSWDYTKSDTEIARENKLVVASVSQWRRKLGKPIIPRDNMKRPYDYGDIPKKVVDWDKADWERGDTEIARELKLTREYVRQKRARLGMPKVYLSELLYKKFEGLFHDIKELSHPEASKLYPGLNSTTFKKYCKRAGITAVRGKNPLHGKFPWPKMDWRLPNLLLSKIWGVPVHKVAIYRSNHPVIGKALFSFYQKTGAMPEKYREMVEAQRLLAEECDKAGREESPKAVSHSEVSPQTVVQSGMEQTQPDHNQSV